MAPSIFSTLGHGGDHSKMYQPFRRALCLQITGVFMNFTGTVIELMVGSCYWAPFMVA
jgi:hypothetical protein